MKKRGKVIEKLEREGQGNREGRESGRETLFNRLTILLWSINWYI